ncbi:MAG: fructosamine kinase family protein [Armatimonadetes bacterium]|nr:fructosamine kinase family protein [Armatimonadota bacterium]MDE2206343.1 fructosamine kinase family protein [Armatimonadota bacterium]
MLGLVVTAVQPVHGGMINESAILHTNIGTIFGKWRSRAAPGFFAAEAHGLEILRRADAFRTPAVIAFRDSEQGAEPAFLLLEAIRPHERQTARPAEVGERLARLHRFTASDFGLERDNFIGLMPQQNGRMVAWAGFYAQRRLAPQIALARQSRALTPDLERDVIRVTEALPELLADVDEPPSLLHGDLWSGNLLTGESGEPVLVDPAVSYSHRELELAYMQLFPGFEPELFAAYEAAWPLSPGYRRRRAVYQIYPLLNHLNHFGAQYLAPLQAACRLAVAPLSLAPEA